MKTNEPPSRMRKLGRWLAIVLVALFWLVIMYAGLLGVQIQDGPGR